MNIISRQPVAIKVESHEMDDIQLQYEYKVYRTISGGPGIPRVHWFGEQGEFDILVMDLLGPSLGELMHLQGRAFSLKSTLMLADQLVRFFP